MIRISVFIPNLNFGFNLTQIEFDLKKFNLNIKNNGPNTIKYRIGFDQPTKVVLLPRSIHNNKILSYFLFSESTQKEEKEK